MSKRIIVPFFGDTHAGSSLGLLNPDTELSIESPDGVVQTAKPKLNSIQEFLWNEVYIPFMQEIMVFAGKDEVFPFHMGDVTQGIKYPEKLLSNKISDQILIATKNLEIWLQYKNVKKMRLLSGTPSHSLGENSSDVLVENYLKTKYPKVDIKTQYYGLLNINGALVDVTHHGPHAGRRVWLRGNEFRYYIRSLITQELMRGIKPPDVIVRAHTHEPIEEWIVIEDHRTCGIITPPLCFPGDFARQITKGVYLVTVGMVALEIINTNDKITFFPWWYRKTLDIRNKEIF